MTLMEMAAKLVVKLETALEAFAQKARAERDYVLLNHDHLLLDLKQKKSVLKVNGLIPEDYQGPQERHLAWVEKEVTERAKVIFAAPQQSWKDRNNKQHRAPVTRQQAVPQQKPYEKPLTHHMTIAPVESPTEATQQP